MLTNSARVAFFIWHVEFLRSLGQQVVNLLSLFFLKDRTGGLLPARRHTFVRQQKSMQKCLVEGISSAGFLWHQQTAMLKKSVRYRGASKSGFYRQKTKRRQSYSLPIGSGTREPRCLRGKCRYIVRPEVTALTGQTCPA